jgi:cytochrome c
MRTTLAAAALGLLAAPAMAQDVTGDAAAGESVFRQCQTCHVVADESGEVLAGRNAKTGPNLYGVVGREAASVEGYSYGDGLVAAAEKGLVWNEAELLPYLQDPTAFLREYTGDAGARSKMTFRVRSEEDALNVIAYIHSLSAGEG